MALDPQIALGYRPPEVHLDVPSPIQQFGQMMSLRGLMEQSQMRQMQMQQEQMQLDTLRQANAGEAEFRRRLTAGETLTPTQTYGVLGPKAGAAYLKSASELEEQQHKTNIVRMNRLGSIIGAATDTPTYNRSVMQAQSEGYFNPDQARALIEQGYDAGRVKQYRDWALTAEQQATNALAQTKDTREAAESAARLASEQTQGRLRGLEYAAQTVPTDTASWETWRAQQPKEIQPLIPPQYSPAAYGLVRQFGVKPTAPVAGRDIPLPAAVVAQKQAIEEAKARAQADPLGVFAGLGGQPAAAGPVISPLAQSIATFEGFDKPGSVAQRNNNPGNLRAGPGQTGTDKQGYAVFPDAATGWAALHDLIQRRSGDDLTLQEFFGGKKGVYPGYAPAGDDNNPQAYAGYVAKQLGVDPAAKLADIPGSQALPARPKLTADTQGQAVLTALPPGVARQVQALSEGRLTFPTGRAASSPYWQQMLDLVGQYDPSFDTNNPGKRATTAKDFASGRSAQQVNALNTVVGHLESLSQAADRLNNTWSPTWNTVANWVSSHTGHPAVQTFEATKKAVVDELTRVWRGTGGSEGDIKSWSATLDAANSPSQLHAVIGQVGDLLESKLNALGDQYREGMGTIAQGRQMITPAARATLDRLEGKPATAPGATAPAATTEPAKTSNFQVGQTVMYNGAPHKIKDIRNGKLVLEP